jgi:hypothetical protein
MRHNALVAIDGGPYAATHSTSIPPNVLTIPKANSLYLNEHGDKMKGVLDMGNNKITNVAEPTEIRDVTTKIYVDNAIREERESINRGFLDNKGLIRSDKLLPVGPVTTFQYFYTLNIGESSASFKLSRFQIPLLFDRTTNLDGTPKYPKLSKQMINLQITTVLDTSTYHDEIFFNIQRYDITYNGLDIYVVSHRPNNPGWGIHLQAHLSLTICFDGILKLNPT